MSTRADLSPSHLFPQAWQTFKRRPWLSIGMWIVYAPFSGGGGGGFTLAVAGLVAGGSADLSLSGAGAGATCIMAYSLAGGGPTSTAVGDVDLSMPINRLPALTADGNGDAGMSVSVPSGAAGVSVWIQAVDMSTSVLSNSLAETVG